MAQPPIINMAQFKSLRRRHMGVEFFVGSYPYWKGSPPSTKACTSKFQIQSKKSWGRATLNRLWRWLPGLMGYSSVLFRFWSAPVKPNWEGPDGRRLLGRGGGGDYLACLEIEPLIPIFGACLPQKSLVEKYSVLYVRVRQKFKSAWYASFDSIKLVSKNTFPVYNSTKWLMTRQRNTLKKTLLNQVTNKVILVAL